MPETPIQRSKNKLVKIYGIGLLVFVAIVGTITAVGSFLAHLNMG